jgi:putative transposase
MIDLQSLSHTVWECKYHIVWIPKCRRKVLYRNIRKELGEIFRLDFHSNLARTPPFARKIE